MKSFKRNFLQHHLAVSHWMRVNQARGGLDPATLQLDIQQGAKRVRFFPQFVVEGAEPDQIGFVSHNQSGVGGFCGWLPYMNKRWEEATDKLAFKRLAALKGLSTPRWGIEGPAEHSFLIKKQRSTFGQGMRGPHAPAALAELGEGEYWEEFLFGQLVKAWFWNGHLAVVEVVTMPTLNGDGQATVAQLAAKAWGPSAVRTISTDLLALQGLAFDAVPATERVVHVEFRYMWPLNPGMNQDHDVRQKIKGSKLEAALQEAGRACWSALPDVLRDQTAFSLDAVITADEKPSFLEINCNPQLHPAFYAAMLDALFAAERVG